MNDSSYNVETNFNFLHFLTMTHLHLPTPSPDAQAASLRLTQRIRQTIVEQNHWIPFSRFMEMALYEPQLGYYSGGSHKIGAEGDFITAPTLSPLFAECLARQLNDLLPHTAGNIYEFGAGTGHLAADLLKHLPDSLNHYYIIELSAELAERQRQWIQTQVPTELAQKVIHVSQLPDTFDGILIGNEVLDAMPVERIQRQNGQWQQIGVSWENGQFIQTPHPLHSPELIRSATEYFPAIDDYTSELHPTQYAFVYTLAQKLTRGGMIWIDYGFDASQYYHPQRDEGTLIGHYRHHTIHDPFFQVGLTDLTAHINFTDIAQAGTDAGLDLIGYTTQTHFLLNLGIVESLSAIGEIDSPAYIREAVAVQKLLNPHEMGELFKVMAFAKHLEADWQGFRQGDICHKL